MLTSLNFTYILFSLVSALIALSVHEFAHGYTAYKLGDNTARNLGRLTLNPLRHIDPIGVVFMIMFKFGWAKPVPINARNFKNPKRDFAITALAGPLSNVIVAFFSIPFCLGFGKLAALLANTFWGILFTNAYIFLALFSMLNVGLGVFNLIPVPPFDGSRLVNALIPAKLYFKVMKYEKYIYWGVIAWLFLGVYVYMGLTSIPAIGTNPILSGILRVFDLSGLIASATEWIYDTMIKFWTLIPFLR